MDCKNVPFNVILSTWIRIPGRSIAGMGIHRGKTCTRCCANDRETSCGIELLWNEIIFFAYIPWPGAPRIICGSRPRIYFPVAIVIESITALCKFLVIDPIQAPRIAAINISIIIVIESITADILFVVICERRTSNIANIRKIIFYIVIIYTIAALRWRRSGACASQVAPALLSIECAIITGLACI